MIYYLLFIACICVVLSTKINTDNFLKLIALGCVAVGSLIGIEQGHNGLVALGVLLYFTSNLLSAYLGNRKRRYYDKVAS